MLPRVLTISALLITLLACTEYDLSGTNEVGGPGGDDGTTEDDGVPDSEPQGGITGRVCAPDGTTWVVGATVSATHDWGTTETTTGADGWFTLEGLPVGHYTVVISKGSFSATFEVEVYADQITPLADEECLEQGDVTIAVVTGDYDHIEDLLTHLGLQYDVIDGDWGLESFLRDPSRLEQYDIVFFNCGCSLDWTTWQTEIGQNLADYVSNGGSIYASDWAYYVIEAGFPAMNTFVGDDAWAGDAFVGEAGMVTGNVLDPHMITTLGSNTALLDYNLSSWAAMEQVHMGQVLIEGSFLYYDPYTWMPVSAYGPLASRMDDGDGTVLYTTFHNEAQTTLDMELLLQEIILSL